MVQPKKRLGQHFLTDPGIAARIVELLDVHEGENVLEIGPGKGILTGWILSRDWPYYAIELDPESIEYLKKNFPGSAHVFLQGDFLEMDLADLVPGPVHIIGNFPYNISSQIFFRILNYKHRVRSVVCMLQKEVARRLATGPGSRDYGILSVLLQAYYTIDYRFTVGPGSFFPAPRVQSGVIRLVRNDTESLPCDESLFFRVVKTAFNQRRKILRNSLKSILVTLEIDSEMLSMRPEQLGVSEFVTLTGLVQSRLEDHRMHS